MTRRTAPPLNRSTAGFTLIELLVALALTGLVVMTAHAVLAQVTDSAARGREIAQALDRAGNRRMWITQAFANVTVGGAPMAGFEGRQGWSGSGEWEADRIAFSTRLPLDTASVERRLRLWLDGDAVLAEMWRAAAGPGDRADTLVLGEDVAAFGADYLVEYGASAAWVRNWVSPVSAPVAVRVRFTYRDGRADTLLLHIGPRG